MDYKWISNHESETDKILCHIETYPDRFFNSVLEHKNISVMCHHAMTESHSGKYPCHLQTPGFDPYYTYSMPCMYTLVQKSFD